jgi:hypothetical protein
MPNASVATVLAVAGATTQRSTLGCGHSSLDSCGAINASCALARIAASNTARRCPTAGHRQCDKRDGQQQGQANAQTQICTHETHRDGAERRCVQIRVSLDLDAWSTSQSAALDSANDVVV